MFEYIHHLFEFSADDDGKRTARVVARSNCVIAEISYTQFKQIVADDPAVMFLLTGQIFNRLRKTSQKVRDLIFLDVKGRIAHALLELCEEPDAMTHPDGMQIKVTRQDLAKMVGCCILNSWSHTEFVTRTVRTSLRRLAGWLTWAARGPQISGHSR